MRKISILLIVAFIATSCAVGTYYPYAQNNFGAQTTVVLDKANFRVVRDVEAIVDVNNTRLSRADVANSAYGELLRKAQLTGSQVLINVVVEEVRRASGGLWRWAYKLPKLVQYVSARATIIEFLDENGNPTVSQPYRPSNYHTSIAMSQMINNESTNIDIQETEISTPQPVQQMTDAEKFIQLDSISIIQRDSIIETHDFISNQVWWAQSNWNFTYDEAFRAYKRIYNSFELIEKEFLLINKIQIVMKNYIKSETKAYPNLKNQLKNASSIEEKIQIFLSYYKE